MTPSSDHSAVVDVLAVNYLMKKHVTRDEVERVLHALGLANYEMKKREPEKGRSDGPH